MPTAHSREPWESDTVALDPILAVAVSNSGPEYWGRQQEDEL